ncbi:ABC transporter ATP-binding protein [Aureimonas fodinaquatilis]|uniref:ABC transporter ATP-binding protein n=1 Tax=Aureimonas fodinaquatilis TaxID=2565783 RepID=A0A5B0E2A7_9HYPH|nr:ABC transporter ATP-binding protein [Aureimonas fodinaquatilis]KAA0972091.1 ABC transporter ATP-binding protein [Aureimonas fodinaquatilis]
MTNVQALPLEIRNLSRKIGSQQILSNIGLDLAAGELLCLVGQSGCGKSTLLRLIAGVDTPDAGVIQLGERVVAGPSAFVEPEQRGVGLMFQDYALFPHMTVAQNVAFGLRGRPRAAIRQKVEETLARLDIGHFATRYPHMLSGGEQQRVALARAIAPGPGILLMDEPFSNLDSRLRETVRAETIGLLRQLGTTTILVTHDPQEALMFADRVALMREGRIVQTGTGRQLYNQPQDPFVARFFSDFNEMRGVCRSGHVPTPFGLVPAGDSAREGDEMLVLIRPGALQPNPQGRSGQAQIVHRQFCGDVEQLALKVEGHPDIVTIRSQASEQFGIGSFIRLDINNQGAFVFPIN